MHVIFIYMRMFLHGSVHPTMGVMVGVVTPSLAKTILDPIGILARRHSHRNPQHH
jgi:hypothetical protein